MQDITDGKINCVIVKDLSRLGREYIETGRYLRRVFPTYGVRFIAITDNIDTAHEGSGDDLTVSVKNIMNEAYCRDISIKTRIFEKELLDTLADMIQEQLDTTLGQYSLGLENLSKEAEEQKNIQAKIASRKQKIQQLRTYQRGLYEGLIQNHLSKDEYFTFKEKYEAKIEAISKEIEQLKAGLAILAKQLEQYKMLSQDAQHIKEDRQLTAALIDRLIDRVEVSREKRITVRFRFQSEFEHCEEVLSQCRNM